MIVFAELSRRAAFLLLENTVEIAEIVETAIGTNLTDRLGSINQHTGSIAQTKVDDILADVTPCMQLEEPAESAWTHTSQIGEHRQAQVVHIVLGYIVLYFQDATAVVLYRHLGIAAGSQRACIVTT